MLLVRFNQAGSALWANRYDVQGSWDVGEAVTVSTPTVSAQQRLRVAGWARTNVFTGSLFDYDGLIVTVHPASGTPQLSELFGDALEDHLLDISRNASGDTVAVGGTLSYSQLKFEAWVVERYDATQQACHDLRFTPTRAAVPLPITNPKVDQPALQLRVEQPLTFPDKVDAAIQCKKVPWHGHGPGDNDGVQRHLPHDTDQDALSRCKP